MTPQILNESISQTQTIHGTGIFTYMYHENQPIPCWWIYHNTWNSLGNGPRHQHEARLSRPCFPPNQVTAVAEVNSPNQLMMHFLGVENRGNNSPLKIQRMPVKIHGSNGICNYMIWLKFMVNVENVCMGRYIHHP